MSTERIRLTGVRVESDTLAAADLEFRPGLNVITGPSDTGKTYICGLIDYMLGAGDPPQDNPISTRYNRGLLGMAAESGVEFTVLRNFKDDSAELYRCPLTRIGPNELHNKVSAAHRTGSTESLSHFLLSQIGLVGKQVKRNQKGGRSALTFRHVAHLMIIGEERIISKHSPALGGQWVKDTEERSVFSFFLTGQDEPVLSTVAIGKTDRVNLVAESSVLTVWIEERKQRLGALIAPETDIKTELERIDQSITAATEFLAATQEQLQLLENNRSDLWGQLQKSRSQKIYLGEQLKRLNLLQQFYESDRARLRAIFSSATSFLSIKDGTCAVCGSQPSEVAPRTVQSVQQGCASEIAKLDVLERELVRGVSDLMAEETTNDVEYKRLEQEIMGINRELQDRLKPRNQNARADIKTLFSSKERLLAAKQIQDEVSELLKKHVEITDRLTPVKKHVAPVSVDSKRLEYAFCERVRQTLERWNFPVGTGVRFDPETFDIVIDDQYRGSFGKGYRALTHAAFTISLMQHCREFGFPHPGFVLLDTPLNPLREPDKGKHDVAALVTNVSDDMKRAFFEDLSRDQSGDQVIVFENSEPPDELKTARHYVHFTKNPGFGRYGFFPRLTT